jgi:hypothetical protein
VEGLSKAAATPISEYHTRILERTNQVGHVQALPVRLCPLLVAPRFTLSPIDIEKMFDKISWLSYMSETIYIRFDIYYFFMRSFMGRWFWIGW